MEVVQLLFFFALILGATLGVMWFANTFVRSIIAIVLCVYFPPYGLFVSFCHAYVWFMNGMDELEEEKKVKNV